MPAANPPPPIPPPSSPTPRPSPGSDAALVLAILDPGPNLALEEWQAKPMTI